MNRNKYDAIVVGSGPNGLAAAITLQKNGLSTLLVEGADSIGGGMRTKELTLPGFKHDVCSAIHPMSVASPFFQTLPLDDYGLEWIYPDIAAAHPLLNGDAGLLFSDVERTKDYLGKDAGVYAELTSVVRENWPKLSNDILGPLRFPSAVFPFIKFGLNAGQPASWVAKRFKTERGKALWAGMAAHSIQPLGNLTTSAIGLVLMALANRYGWPIPKGGSQSIADALGNYFESLGGEIQCGTWLSQIKDLPNHKLLLLDLTPNQILKIGGLELKNSYVKQLKKYKHGMGIFKIDWALSDPTPFKNSQIKKAGTVHIGNTFADIARSEALTSKGVHVAKPFVLFSQPSLFDKTRAPKNRHVGWAYCHVPNGSTVDMTERIENQIERFAPGFRDTIIQRHTFDTVNLEAYNPNYIGGDINGGIMDLSQLYSRPTLRFTPYRTSAKNVYICSSATPPGPGVHGMAGYHAARTALKDHFNLLLP